MNAACLVWNVRGSIRHIRHTSACARGHRTASSHYLSLLQRELLMRMRNGRSEITSSLERNSSHFQSARRSKATKGTSANVVQEISSCVVLENSAYKWQRRFSCIVKVRTLVPRGRPTGHEGSACIACNLSPLWGDNFVRRTLLRESLGLFWHQNSI